MVNFVRIGLLSGPDDLVVVAGLAVIAPGEVCVLRFLDRRAVDAKEIRWGQPGSGVGYSLRLWSIAGGSSPAAASFGHPPDSEDVILGSKVNENRAVDL